MPFFLPHLLIIWILASWTQASVYISSVIPISASDPSSFSNVDIFVLRHLSLNWTVDFASKTVYGSAELTFAPSPDRLASADGSLLILDSRALDISSILLKETGNELSFYFAHPHPFFGSALVIEIPPAFQNQSFSLVIRYSTTSAGSALQWLEARHTTSQRHPFLFSQCWPIHARSLVPCQDTPAVKFTYDAEVFIPPDLEVLMSAIREVGPVLSVPLQNTSLNRSVFRQTIPIPAYLLALAVGDLESRVIGPRSQVWADPKIVDAAAFEFSETESFIRTAEGIGGPYVWGRYGKWWTVGLVTTDFVNLG